MNIVFDKIVAAASAQVADRSSLVRTMAACCCLACCCAAQAGDKEHEPQRASSAPQAQRVERQAERRAERQAERQAEAPRQMDQRAFDEQRRQQVQMEQAARNNDTFRRNGRLTADERRDLRRQINEAGQDLYPNTPRR